MSQNTVREGSSPEMSHHNRKVLIPGLNWGGGLELAQQRRFHCEDCGILWWEQMAAAGSQAWWVSSGYPTQTKLCKTWQTVRKEEILYRRARTHSGYLGPGLYKSGTSRRALWDPHHGEGQKKTNGMLLESMWSWYLHLIYLTLTLSFPTSLFFLSLCLTFAVK